MDLKIDSSSAPAYRNLIFHSIVTFLGQSLMQVVDLVFCRDLGSLASATVGTATSFLAWYIVLGIGLISSLEFLIPHALGAKKEKKADEYYYAGIVLILVLSAVSSLALILTAQWAPHYGMNPELVTPVQHFSRILSLSYFPVFMIPLFRIELQSRGYQNDVTIATLYGNLLNIFLNWMLVKGHLGVPALGLTGSACANVISRFGIFLYLGFRTLKVRREYHLSLPLREIPFRERIAKILKVGGPSSLHMMFEVGAFIFVSALASRLSAAQNAAHAIAISIASFVFMIPAGMSSAAAITMSRAIGEKDLVKGLGLGKQTLTLGLVYAAIASLIFFTARGSITSLYTSDSETYLIGTNLLWIAALFQFGDAMQVILAGCLRGLGETRAQAIMNAIGHWGIGIPVGMFLAFRMNQGINGLWLGLCLGLFAVAILLYFRYRKISEALLLKISNPS